NDEGDNDEGDNDEGDNDEGDNDRDHAIGSLAALPATRYLLEDAAEATLQCAPRHLASPGDHRPR
ncbi:MAG: hypothetical protein KAI47_03260, partial [Deltaproteobacteria bacterium]|nr:hypothetical protein [Deltaproteobacteria bacterium]